MQTTTTLYRKSPQEARERNEMQIFRLSHIDNENARKELDELINQNNDGMHLNTDAILAAFLTHWDVNRLALILSAHIADRPYDGRFSREVKDFAAEIMNGYSNDFQTFAKERYYLNSHSVLIDGLARAFVKYIG